MSIMSNEHVNLSNICQTKRNGKFEKGVVTRLWELANDAFVEIQFNDRKRELRHINQVNIIM